MKKFTLCTAAAAALLSLAACQNEVEEVDSRAPDPMASELANAAPVELPPAISASVTFRCQPGNEVIAVDFFTGDQQANLRVDPEAPTGTMLRAGAAGQPYTGEGYTLTGDRTGVTLDQPEGPTLTCST
ncbi:hypothetical protein [Sphingosinithalassobacter sp. LHW66-3]|uniref:hypothetical protein n=1 Tax=Sphingosinithalassobacter sp. LHW66-3 TaxID=3424718 RepID=UPI003D6B55EE